MGQVLKSTSANVRLDDGSVVYVEQGAELPDNADPDAVKRLEGLGAFNDPAPRNVELAPESVGSPTSDGRPSPRRAAKTAAAPEGDSTS